MNFREWYTENQFAITWWLIGFLTFSMIDNIALGRYNIAAIDAILIFANYKLNGSRD